ncbi:MAG: hypothetical protein K1X73_05380 [Bacteroidia bacterium]|jgi:hypothetical protein|nr:hypothetical protein [Bacteroidia bacterium]HMU76584.1 hypothetical protein [Bacteroidia bacterium]HMW09539.1 hypothetical protein [Bacteroidia bacterium]HMX97369.1 hypothetical protein [Bacteroidia bacterium]HMY12345.1 hypothetical protein [Bacteroidia bacterium]
MNKLKMFFIAAAITFVLSGCGTKQSNNSSVEKVNKAVNDEPVQYDPDETIELDNGQKWKVNEEMKPFLLKGKEILNEYIQNEDNDYTGLAAALSEQDNKLIESCTMEGKSHEELHKWLHPHLDIISDLESTKDTAVAKKLVEQLKASYVDFEKYFQ